MRYFATYKQKNDIVIYHYIGTNKEYLQELAKEKKLRFKEITKYKYTWLSIGFRPEQIFDL